MFFGENSAWAQTAPEPVKPYVFENDLRTLPPPPAEIRKAHRPGTKRDFEPTPFRAGPPDPLWHPGERPRTLAPITPHLLAAGVTPSEFLTPSLNFDTNQSGRHRDGRGRVYDQRNICKKLIRHFELTALSGAHLQEVCSSCATSRGSPFSGSAKPASPQE
jgi:hypothetical protein